MLFMLTALEVAGKTYKRRLFKTPNVSGLHSNPIN